MATYGSDSENPNYIESVASLKRKTKEDIRIDQLIPSQVLEDAGDTGIKQLLEYYYKFMNMKEFTYVETQTYVDNGVASGKAVFRIPDPNLDNNKFFGAKDGAGSTLVITQSNGTEVSIPLNSTNWLISNGNELPGSLATSTNPYGKTVTISGLTAYNGLKATLTTPQTNWVGPGPSYIINAIEESMNIDENETKHLDMMQKEIASLIPKDLNVDKRALYKNITEFYKLKGSQDAIEIFFRLLFNENVEVEYPWDNTLKPSDGKWDQGLNAYTDDSGFLNTKAIKIQDSYRYQKFSYNIKTGKNVADWSNIFERLVHPAGFIFFGEIMILTELTRAALGDDDRISSYTFGEGASSSQNDGTGNIQVPGLTDVMYRYLDIYGRTNRKTLSSMPGLQPGFIGKEDVALLVEAFASLFLPNFTAIPNHHAVLSTNINSSGVIDNISIVDPGHGYTGTQTITVTGDGNNAAATVTVNSRGELDTVTISNGGSGYSYATSTVPAVSNPGTIQQIYLSGLHDKTYTAAPQLIISAPTAVDSDGVPLSSNVQATAAITLDSEGEIASIAMSNVGAGYGNTNPTIRISSPTSSEKRGKDMHSIIRMLLNHVDITYTNGVPSTNTYTNNDYFMNKKNYYTTKKFRDGYPISFFSDKTIGSTYETDINKYNVKTHINLDPVAD